MAGKKTKTIEVTLLGCGEAVVLNASDTATDPNATYALDDFKDEKYMVLKDRENEGTVNYVPFHAVDHISVEEGEIIVGDRPDPYGCYELGYKILWGKGLITEGLQLGDTFRVPTEEELCGGSVDTITIGNVRVEPGSEQTLTEEMLVGARGNILYIDVYCVPF